MAYGIFLQNGDVENGKPIMPGLQLIEPLGRDMGDIVEECCSSLEGLLEGIARAKNMQS